MRASLTISLTVAAVLAVASPAMATAPAVRTASTSGRTPTGARLLGAVNPHGKPTTYYFQYGKTTAYGSQTGPVSAGSGTSGVPVSADITGLTPATTYHYRIVATNADGTTNGADKSFATAKQPLGLSLLATPNPARFGGPITLSGTLTGTGAAGRALVLQANAFPYTAGFANVGNPQLTNSTGGFAFPVLSLSANTQYRVVTTTDPVVRSPVVIAGSAAIVRTAVGSVNPRARTKVRFAGSVSPKLDGSLYAIQKQKGATWVTVAGSSLRSYTEGSSRYAINVRIAHSGTYRVFVGVADGAHVSASGPSVAIKVRPRR